MTANSGNENCSREDVQAVGRLVRAILAVNATSVDREGKEKPITLDDILIITPYNAQVFEIQQCLPGGRVGTVDELQGPGSADRHLFDGNIEVTRMPHAGWSSSTAGTRTWLQ